MSSFSIASSMFAAMRAFYSRTLSRLSAFFLMGIISLLCNVIMLLQSIEFHSSNTYEHLSQLGKSLFIFVYHELIPVF